jgi:glycerophosphoryl diester phosphodiesterase
MRPTRRDLAFLVAACAIGPQSASAASGSKIIISDGGATGEWPACTAGAYQRAVADGADFLAVDLVASQTGDLIARPDNELSKTTDVAGHPEFADRKTSKLIDNVRVEGWFAEDFTLADLHTLTCLGLQPAPKSSRLQADQSKILSFQELIDLARGASVRTARVVGVYARLRRAEYFASIGLPLEGRVVDAIKLNGYNSKAAAMFIAAPESATLKSVRALSRARCVQLMTKLDFAVDSFAARTFSVVKGLADAVGLDEAAVHAEPSLIEAAHASGLAVHVWASKAPRKADDTRRTFASLFAAGADAIVTGDAGLAALARADALRLKEGQHPTSRL